VNLSWYDWAIMAAAVVLLRFVSLSTRQYVKGVADFLSANRSAGRYLLTISSQMGNWGVISYVALFEMTYQAGFPPVWWALMGASAGTIITLTGWVFYRFRETRALTMAQFLEMRYSRRFRIFAGFLCWLSGILNFGIFPAVAARFFMYFCGLPGHFHIPGIEWPISTFAAIIAVDLGLALMFVNIGGQVSVMVTECVQGMFCSLAFVVVSATILLQLQWPQIVGALSLAPPNASMLHPFHTSHVKDFNIWFFLIGLFGAFYNYNSWQGAQGFYSSARSPHEQKMGGIIGMWRSMGQSLMALLLPVAAFAVLHLPEFSAQAAAVQEGLKHIHNETLQGQMRVPLAMACFLPAGVKGLLATIMLFTSFTCHDTYMHSWGSIFVQDVLMPIRKKPLQPQQHMNLLRWSIIGVAVFAFVFSLLYPQTQKIFMFFAITGTIWLGGSGAVIVGGLYWRRGSTPAAYSAVILGAALGVAGLIVPNVYAMHYHRDFPINGQVLWFIAMIGAILVYVIVSLLTSRQTEGRELERILRRGRYAVPTAQREVEAAPPRRWMRFVGISREFSRSDRALAIALVAWQCTWLAIFVALTIANLALDVPTAWWARYWHFWVLLQFSISLPVTAWFTLGGVADIRALFRTLAATVRDHTDDGRVMHEQAEAASLPARATPSQPGSEARPECAPDER